MPQALPAKRCPCEDVVGDQMPVALGAAPPAAQPDWRLVAVSAAGAAGAVGLLYLLTRR